jgi:glycosyltransferase involved in cell wall biosynthesis
VDRRLRVGINAIFLEPGMGGIETYLIELAPSLLRAQPDMRLTLLCNRQGHEVLEAQPWSDAVGLVTPRATRRGFRALYELGPLGAFASRHFDVLHSPALTAPLATEAANVVVIHDTTWITAPDFGKGQAATVRLWRAVVPVVARRADRVIAISRASADDIERHLRVPADRIDIVPNGFGTPPRAAPSRESELRARLGLGSGPILLNLGAKKIHKNQLRLVQAFAAVRAAAPEARLVLAGARTPYEDRLREEAAKLGVSDAVRFPGYVDEADLEGLYAAASVFVFPSLNEGFGLPVLEAMSRGVPVVTSSVSSLPEVAGDAALLVDPMSTEAIAEATTRVLTDRSLRERLVEAGRKRPAAFSWERTAKATVETWRRALGAD